MVDVDVDEPRGILAFKEAPPPMCYWLNSGMLSTILNDPRSDFDTLFKSLKCCSL